MLHTFSVISKRKTFISLLEWEAAQSIAEEGDLILSIKDNHICSVREVEVVDDRKRFKRWEITKKLTS